MSGNNARSWILVVVVVVSVAVVAVYRQQRGAVSAGSDGHAGPAQHPGLPRMVDVGADACAACREMAPILTALKHEYAGRATIEFVDVWENPEAGEQYAVRVIPTQIFYDTAGREIWRHEGFLTRAEIVARLADLGVR